MTAVKATARAYEIVNYIAVQPVIEQRKMALGEPHGELMSCLGQIPDLEIGSHINRPTTLWGVFLEKNGFGSLRIKDSMAFSREEAEAAMKEVGVI